MRYFLAHVWANVLALRYMWRGFQITTYRGYDGRWLVLLTKETGSHYHYRYVGGDRNLIPELYEFLHTIANPRQEPLTPVVLVPGFRIAWDDPTKSGTYSLSANPPNLAVAPLRPGAGAPPPCQPRAPLAPPSRTIATTVWRCLSERAGYLDYSQSWGVPIHHLGCILFSVPRGQPPNVVKWVWIIEQPKPVRPTRKD
jgi:hypothetical protein